MEDFAADLDAELAEYGEDIILRAPGSPDVDVTVRARWDDLDAEPLVPGSGVMQKRARVIISPTGLAAWPSAGSPRNPRQGDKAVRFGRAHNIEHVKLFQPGGELVRLELLVAG